jgi:hypothetical protein
MADVANTPEHTGEQADDLSASPMEVERPYQPLVTFNVRCHGNYDEYDLETNKITKLPATEQREYIESLKVLLTRNRLIKDVSRCPRICVPLSNESPSGSRWSPLYGSKPISTSNALRIGTSHPTPTTSGE